VPVEKVYISQNIKLPPHCIIANSVCYVIGTIFANRFVRFKKYSPCMAWEKKGGVRK
jgi:hypothetical protein